MAAGRIDIITRMMMEDGDFNSKSQSVLKMLKKISTTDTLIKLKFDDKDFRRELQKELDSASQELRKAMHIKQGKAITYKNDKGETKDVNTEASIRRLQEFALKQSSNNALSTKERNYWNTVREAAEGYLSTINKTREAIKEVERLNRAKLSGRVQATREQTAKEERARINEAKNNLKNEEKGRAAADREAASVRAAQSKRVYEQQAKQDEQQRKALEAAQKKEELRTQRIAELNKKADDLTRQHRDNYNTYYGKDDVAYNQEKLSLLQKQLAVQKKIDELNNGGKASQETKNLEFDIRQTRNDLKAAKQQQAEKKKLIELDKQLADVERRRADNQKLTVNTNQRLQNEIALTQKKLGLLRQIDLIQNGGKPSERTLAEESRLRNLQHTNSLLQQQGGILGRLKGLATQYLSIFAVWNFGKKIVETTGYFEQQKVALEGILGSASDAEKAFTRMQKMALQSPFELREIVDQTKQAAAYGIGDGDTNKLLEDVKMLGDLSAGLGVDMQRLILAYGQVKAAAVLRGQELRQFTEAGIPMVQALADKFTQLNGKLVTTGEVFELISKRQVSFEMVASVMRDMTAEGGKFNNMQEKITETLYGQMQKLKDMWTQSMNSIGSGMNTALMGIVKILQAIVKHAGSLMKGGIIIALYSAIKKIGPQLILLKENVKSTGVAFRYLRISASQATGALATTKAVARGLGAVFSSLATGGVLFLVSALVSLGAAMTQANREFKRKMDDIDSSFQKDEERLTTGFDNLISKIQNFAAGTKAYNQALDSLKSNYGEYISSGLIQKMEEERNAIDKTTLSWHALAESVKEAIKVKMQYERSETEMEAETNAIAESMTSFGSIFKGRNLKEILQQYIKNYEIRNDVTGTSKTGLTPSNMERYVNNTLDTFRINRGRTLKDFKKAFSEQNISNSTIREILQNALPSIFDSVKKSGAFDKYISSLNDLESNPLFKITEAFANAEKRADRNNEGRFAGKIGSDEYKSATSAASKAYNPIAWENMRKGELLSAAKGLVEEFYGAITDSNLKKRFEQAFTVGKKGMTIGKTKEAVDAISELIGTLDSETDATKIMELNTVLKELQDRAGTVSGYVAEVAEDFNKFFGRQNSAEMEDFYKRYMPNNENYEQKLKEVESDRKAAADWLEKNAKWKKGERGTEYARMVLEKQWLDEIWGGGKNGKFFNQSKKAKKGGGGTRELTDFFNLLKNPYEQYKRATQQGGVGGGIAFMRTNKTIQDMYGGMFGGDGGVDFNKKIGNKTFGEIILGKDGENLIKGGLEDGVLDFRKAGEALANELEAYYKGNKQERGSYLRMAEQVRKWVTDTFTRDAVTQWLEDLQKATKELQRSFEQTSKGIDLYRRLAQNGTVEGLAASAGVSQYGIAAVQPNSARLRANILSSINGYNERIASMQALDNEHRYSPFSLGRIQTLDDVASARNRLENNKELNKAFYATDEGKQMFDHLTNALNQLENAIREEYASISGENFTGNAMQDTIAEALRKAGIAQFVNMRAQMNARDKGFGYDAGAGKAYNETMSQQANALYEQFVKNNDFSAMVNAGRYFGGASSRLDGLMNKFDKLIEEIEKTAPALAAELRSKKIDFQQKELAFRADSGDFGGLMQSVGQFFGADEIAQSRYNEVNNRRKELEFGASYLEQQINNGQDTLAEEDLQQMTQELNTIQSQLATCNKELQEMGVNGENFEKKLRMDALKNIQANLAKSKDTLGSMQSAVNGVVDSAKALSKAINKVYDVMLDGENPAWMQDMDAFLEDFGEAFNMLIAPITAVISMITALAIVSVTAEAAMTPLLIVMLAIIAAAVIVAAIVAAFQQHDRRLQRSIENIDKNLEALDNAITNLNAAAERQVGLKKLRTEIDATSKSLQKATEYANQALLEEQKKNSDIDKIEEYKQKSQEAIDEYKNGIQDIVDGITSSTSNWSESISSAIRSAFQNGENAVRSFASVAKQMIGDVVETMLRMAILEPLIQQALQDWTNSDALQQMFTKQVADVDKDGNVIKDANGNTLYHSELDTEGYTKALLENINDEDKAKAFYTSMLGIGDTLIDAVDGLPRFLKDAYAFNADTQSLSGGIQGMTEDTGRTLEGLGNSILMQHVLTNQKMDEIKALPFAQVQTSWFKDMLVQSQAIATATADMRNAIADMRNGVRPLYVTMQ